MLLLFFGEPPRIERYDKTDHIMSESSYVGVKAVVRPFSGSEAKLK